MRQEEEEEEEEEEKKKKEEEEVDEEADEEDEEEEDRGLEEKNKEIMEEACSMPGRPASSPKRPPLSTVVLALSSVTCGGRGVFEAKQKLELRLLRGKKIHVTMTRVDGAAKRRDRLQLQFSFHQITALSLPTPTDATISFDVCLIPTFHWTEAERSVFERTDQDFTLGASATLGVRWVLHISKPKAADPAKVREMLGSCPRLSKLLKEKTGLPPTPVVHEDDGMEVCASNQEESTGRLAGFPINRRPMQACFGVRSAIDTPPKGFSLTCYCCHAVFTGDDFLKPGFSHW